MSGKYHNSWKEYKRLQFGFYTVFVIFGIFFFSVVPTFDKSQNQTIDLVIGIPLFLVWNILGFCYRYWKCPRCHHSFASKNPLLRTTGGSKCAYCGLPKYAEDDI